MSRRTQVLIKLITLLAAAGVGLYGVRRLFVRISGPGASCGRNWVRNSPVSGDFWRVFTQKSPFLSQERSLWTLRGCYQPRNSLGQAFFDDQSSHPSLRLQHLRPHSNHGAGGDVGAAHPGRGLIELKMLDRREVPRRCWRDRLSCGPLFGYRSHHFGAIHCLADNTPRLQLAHVLLYELENPPGVWPFLPGYL